MPTPSEPAKEPLLSDDHPTRPFESCRPKFFVVAGKPLSLVDRLSGDLWASLAKRHYSVPSNLLPAIPKVGVSPPPTADGGPQFTRQEFRQFMDRWGVHMWSVTKPPEMGCRGPH
ncbi:hypothetical protein GWK47_010507 [Chionoecetes opilio]|uniref:Uncharacterized protein n=1 Tax=Chionoecetes opilio TaxID=41210 RepID=A0A8J4XW74_CHIOP|nr:hypothetical protein GWK47_010507 [Chionoecetes opilio]